MEKAVSVPDTHSCSKDHQKIYQDWFIIADSDGDGRLTGNDATKIFALSNLSRPELKQVWALADSKRQGFLGLTEFITAMQLIALAQEGHEINSAHLKNAAVLESLNLPVMEGLAALQTAVKISPVKEKLEENGTAELQCTPLVKLLKRKSTKKTNSDFDAKPMVMLLGQYSTGKTTFIKHLLGCSYPGAHIGPEPTNDRFIVVMSGPDESSIPGNTVAVHAEMPFTGLTTFGGAFLSKFECSQMPHPLLEHLTFVDTPGVLSGEKQQTQRGYDFAGVISWFAAKCDMIFLLFDPHKLDISDEFKRAISSLCGNDDKIRVVLNKADQVDTQQLLRVYGALMWSLAKILSTPEVVRVYIGSFNDKPVNEEAIGPIGKNLFEKKQDDILMDLMDIPRKACDRRVQREFHLPVGDFPNVEHFREVLKGGYKFDDFEKMKPKLIQAVDDMLDYDIPELLRNFRNPFD